MNYSTFLSRLSALGVLVGLAGTAQAAGFEKATSWSGRNAAIGGAAASSVSGPEALFFNPAGIGGEGMGVSAQLSPTWTQAKGPVIADDEEVDGERKLSPVFGILGDYGIDEKLNVGLGLFVAGGTKAVYEGISFEDLNDEFSLEGQSESNLSIVELSPGASYQVAPGLRIGAAWRASFVKGKLVSTSASNLNDGDGAGAEDIFEDEGNYLAQNVTLGDLSGTAFAGFRLGAQYAPEGAGWGVGLNVRTPVNFELEGTTSGKAQLRFAGGGVGTGNADLSSLNELNDDPASIDGDDVTVASQLPTQVSFGSHMELSDTATIYFEYTWTNYKAVDKIKIDGDIALGDETINEEQGDAPGLGAVADGVGAQVNGKEVSLPDFVTKWKDQHQIRVGSEIHAIENLPIRIGYVLTTQVVPSKYARATFSSPGLGHTITAGVGTMIAGATVDAALEYSMASGEGKSPALTGDYSTSAYAAHLGATYRF